ncbi:rCG57671, isoform CRA_a [Rattus norvegicus]|uniref:RCG57671, isoform CRA_a n=1 Tax=Rattus norvegicus TaxID=10116 RepID=A6JI93_RAT|nr:rCG57671, isoform CRA_a [Rattus norvegicus]
MQCFLKAPCPWEQPRCNRSEKWFLPGSI